MISKIWTQILFFAPCNITKWSASILSSNKICPLPAKIFQRGITLIFMVKHFTDLNSTQSKENLNFFFLNLTPKIFDKNSMTSSWCQPLAYLNNSFLSHNGPILWNWIGKFTWYKYFPIFIIISLPMLKKSQKQGRLTHVQTEDQMERNI